MVTEADGSIGDLLFGKTRQAVMGLLFLRPDESFHLRQIVRLGGAGVGPVQRELAQLTAAGLIVRKAQGRQVYFQAARSPVFNELRGLLVKTAGCADVLRDAPGAAGAGHSRRVHLRLVRQGQRALRERRGRHGRRRREIRRRGPRAGCPAFPPEVMEQWREDKLEQFGDRWPQVETILDYFASQLDIYLLDIHPGNMAFVVEPPTAPPSPPAAPSP